MDESEKEADRILVDWIDKELGLEGKPRPVLEVSEFQSLKAAMASTTRSMDGEAKGRLLIQAAETPEQYAEALTLWVSCAMDRYSPLEFRKVQLGTSYALKRIFGHFKLSKAMLLNSCFDDIQLAYSVGESSPVQLLVSGEHLQAMYKFIIPVMAERDGITPEMRKEMSLEDRRELSLKYQMQVDARLYNRTSD